MRSRKEGRGKREGGRREKERDESSKEDGQIEAAFYYTLQDSLQNLPFFLLTSIKMYLLLPEQPLYIVKASTVRQDGFNLAAHVRGRRSAITDAHNLSRHRPNNPHNVLAIEPSCLLVETRRGCCSFQQSVQRKLNVRRAASPPHQPAQRQYLRPSERHRQDQSGKEGIPPEAKQASDKKEPVWLRVGPSRAGPGQAVSGGQLFKLPADAAALARQR